MGLRTSTRSEHLTHHLRGDLLTNIEPSKGVGTGGMDRRFPAVLTAVRCVTDAAGSPLRVSRLSFVLPFIAGRTTSPILIFPPIAFASHRPRQGDVVCKSLGLHSGKSVLQPSTWSRDHKSQDEPWNSCKISIYHP